jgi:hypothetical protein
MNLLDVDVALVVGAQVVDFGMYCRVWRKMI